MTAPEYEMEASRREITGSEWEMEARRSEMPASRMEIEVPRSEMTASKGEMGDPRSVLNVWREGTEGCRPKMEGAKSKMEGGRAIARQIECVDTRRRSLESTSDGLYRPRMSDDSKRLYRAKCELIGHVAHRPVAND